MGSSVADFLVQVFAPLSLSLSLILPLLIWEAVAEFQIDNIYIAFLIAFFLTNVI